MLPQMLETTSHLMILSVYTPQYNAMLNYYEIQLPQKTKKKEILSMPSSRATSRPQITDSHLTYSTQPNLYKPIPLLLLYSLQTSGISPKSELSFKP